MAKVIAGVRGYLDMMLLPLEDASRLCVLCPVRTQTHTFIHSPSHKEPSLAFLEVDLLIKRWLGRRMWAHSCPSITALRLSGYFVKNWGRGGVRA